MKVTIDIDDNVIEHILGDSCEAGAFKPCGLSGHVMKRVYEAVREEAAPETAAERDRLLAVNAAMLEALQKLSTWSLKQSGVKGRRAPSPNDGRSWEILYGDAIRDMRKIATAAIERATGARRERG